MRRAPRTPRRRCALRIGGVVALGGCDERHERTVAASERRVRDSCAATTACAEDKDVRAICGALAPLANKILVTRVSSERAADPGVLLQHCRAANPIANVQPFEHLGNALSMTRNDSRVVVTGSLHFIGEALELLQLSDAPSERELNEYMPKK